MPGHVTASQAYGQLRQITAKLNRSTLPRLPPELGFSGDVEHHEQMHIWREWIKWEKDDPLVLKDDDLAEYKRRILYVYKQATITMRFEPEFWYDAAQWGFNNAFEEEGDQFLKDGASANPESCLLAFRRADRLETKTLTEEGGPEALKRQGATVREPYDALLNALYLLIDQIQEREKKDIARIQERFALQAAPDSDADSDADEDSEDAQKARNAAQEAQIKAIQSGNTAQVEKLRKLLSHVWIALMRTMRRIQGKGKPGAEIGGFRGILIEARKRGKITSDVYVASALIEHQCYKDPHATKIFERGMKLFPEDENFALEYIKHLIDINDSTSKYYL
jgi:cleavage stimulation factor subunit 3